MVMMMLAAKSAHAADAMTSPRRLSSMRSFDPCRLGDLEAASWVAYYRREWPRLMYLAVAGVRAAYGLPRPTSVYGAALAARAIRCWAPKDDNDPDGARRALSRLYELAATHNGERFDVGKAAWLEVDWWRVHREVQYGSRREGELVDALAALYAHVFAVAPDDVRFSAEQRALAMQHCDRWVAGGCGPATTLMEEARSALVRSYASLLAVVHVG